MTSMLSVGAVAGTDALDVVALALEGGAVATAVGGAALAAGAGLPPTRPATLSPAPIATTRRTTNAAT